MARDRKLDEFRLLTEEAEKELIYFGRVQKKSLHRLKKLKKVRRHSVKRKKKERDEEGEEDETEEEDSGAEDRENVFMKPRSSRTHYLEIIKEMKLKDSHQRYLPMMID